MVNIVFCGYFLVLVEVPFKRFLFQELLDEQCCTKHYSFLTMEPFCFPVHLPQFVAGFPLYHEYRIL